MLLTAEALRHVYAQLPIAACVIDRALVFLAANEKYAQLLRLPLESIVGRSMVDLKLDRQIANVRRDFTTFDQQGVVPDHEIPLWDGTYFVCVSPVGPSEDVQAISITLVNITQHKHLQRDLALTIDELTHAQSETHVMAYTDAMTGLGNRRALDDAFVKATAQATSRVQALALLMIDVDVFKAYNDMHGHLAGDDCLRSIAQVLLTTPRDAVLAATRFGGEEFVVLLSAADEAQAVRVAQAIRDRVAALTIPHPGSPHGVVTVSIGVAHGSSLGCAPPATETRAALHDLLQAADGALYAAKSQGRNRVSCA